MLTAQINFTFIKDPDKAQAAIEASQATEKQFMRLPGMSKSGTCPDCAQYLYMVHDKSGDVVPLVQLHDNCVCHDVELNLAELKTRDLKPMKKGEWFKKNVASVSIGKRAMRLLDENLVTASEVIAKTTADVLVQRPQIELVGIVLERCSLKRLKTIAFGMGYPDEDIRKASKAQLLNAIMTKKQKLV